MPTSVYFNNYNSYAEQRVVEDLIVESIKIQGFDAYYLPNDNDQARDLLFGEDPVKKFSSAFPVELYLSSALEYTGEKEFFSKFGLEIKNNVNVILSKRTFSQRVPQNSFQRPREGDLVYVPFLNGTGELYEIKFTNHTKDFFTLGRKIPYFYELELEKFRYSQEVINTGVEAIDDVASQSAYTVHIQLTAGTGNYIPREIIYSSTQGIDGYENATIKGLVQNWDAANGILSVTNIMGDFTNPPGNTAPFVHGLTSNAVYTLVTIPDALNNPSTHESYDNKLIRDSANTIIDTTEINPNPFGNA